MRGRFSTRITFIAACVIAWTVAGTAQATSIMERLRTVGGAAGFNTAGPEATGFSRYVGAIINGAMSLLGVIFVAQMVYAGYLWMTARDEADQVDKAKHIIRRSIIGLAIVLAAWAITRFVLTRLYLAAG